MNSYTFYYLYLMKDDRNHFKIGVSENPKLREGEIKVHNPTTKLLLWSCLIGENMNVLKLKALEYENLLHNRFRNKRIWGEWFRLDKKDIVRIWKLWGFSQMPRDGKFISANEVLADFWQI